MHPESDLSSSEDKQREASDISSISIIVSGLLADSKQDGMLDRLQAKLGKSKEEIFKLISEL